MKMRSRRGWLAVIGVLLALLLLPLLVLPGGAPASAGKPEAAAAAPAGVAVPRFAREGDGDGAPGGDPRGERGAAELPPAMRGQVADIARAYAANARFPSYSTPLAASDWAQLNPQAFVPRQAPLSSLPGVSATIVLERYLVDRAGDLPVRVLLSSAAPGETGAAAVAAVRVRLRQQQQSSAPVTLAPAGAARFAGVLPASALRAVPAGDVIVVAEIDTVAGERATVTAMARSYDSAARLRALGEARIEGPDLVIPARFEVTAPGFYRVQANLFTADGKVPVSHLNAEFPLAHHTSTGALKVHAATLRAAQQAGPYQLQDIVISRLPDEPGLATGFGSAAAARFAVRGFPLAAYGEARWEDPEAAQRLQFLQALGGAPGGQ